MDVADMTSDKIRAFWDARANLGVAAGSNDFILKDLETTVFLERIKHGSSVVDIGCGNGKTLIALAQKNGCKGMGVDFSAENIKLAHQFKKDAELGNEIIFKVKEIPGGLSDMDLFDYAITQRCLVNLLTKEEQKKAFCEIMSCVKPGGCYLMIEDSQQGLMSLNTLRSRLDLSPIPAPWHNLFLNEEDVAKWATDEYVLTEGPNAVASTYYFLSRVIYAKIGEKHGLKPEELKYDSEINLLAYGLPRDIGDWGAPKLWLWQRCAG
ncbi:MAG: class I SAM-dependent methyltransferase [Proteobacteria bacterium]|nr:class I SAM-dependent methyltransferase [Pseudomonadota bacterium]